MVVGEANKGKTSLLLSLTRRGKVTRFKEVAMDRHKEPLATNGVELGDWEYAPGRKEKVTFMTWDFGGQVREGGKEGGREGRDTWSSVCSTCLGSCTNTGRRKGLSIVPNIESVAKTLRNNTRHTMTQALHVCVPMSHSVCWHSPATTVITAITPQCCLSVAPTLRCRMYCDARHRYCSW